MSSKRIIEGKLKTYQEWAQRAHNEGKKESAAFYEGVVHGIALTEAWNKVEEQTNDTNRDS